MIIELSKSREKFLQHLSVLVQMLRLLAYSLESDLRESNSGESNAGESSNSGRRLENLYEIIDGHDPNTLERDQARARSRKKLTYGFAIALVALFVASGVGIGIWKGTCCHKAVTKNDVIDSIDSRNSTVKNWANKKVLTRHKVVL